MKSSLWQAVKLVFVKEFTVGMRFKAAWAAMFMFALTTLACVSMALQGGAVELRLLAALLWVCLFFAAMAGADRVFADEDTAGTLLTLRIFGPSKPQAARSSRVIRLTCSAKVSRMASSIEPSSGAGREARR